MTPMRAMYESTPEEHRGGITWEQFVLLFNDYEFDPIMDGDEVVGAVMSKGSEVHVGTLRTPHGARGVMRRVIKRVIHKHGEIKAVVPIRCAEYAERLKRFGFTESGRDDKIIHLELKGVPSWAGK